MGEEAGARLAAAGRQADAMGDPVRARSLLERALELLPADSDERAAAMVELAAAGWNLLPLEELRRLLRAGTELAAARGLRALELRAHVLALGAVAGESAAGRPSDLEMLAETTAALNELEALDDSRALATALSTRAWIECALGHAADGVESSLRAVNLSRAGGHDAVWPLGILGWAVVESPMPVPAADALLDGLMDELGMRPTVRSELVVAQAMLAQLGGRVDEAWRLIDIGRTLERDLGRDTMWRLAEHEGLLLMRTERWDDARVALRSFAAELERRGATDELAVVHGRLAIAEARAGDIAAALAATRGGVDADGYEARTRAHLALAEIHLARADAGAAVASAQVAIAVAVSGDWVLLQAEAELTLARALQAAGDPAADAARQRAAGLYAAKGYPGGVARAGRLAPA